VLATLQLIVAESSNFHPMFITVFHARFQHPISPHPLHLITSASPYSDIKLYVEN